FAKRGSQPVKTSKDERDSRTTTRRSRVTGFRSRFDAFMTKSGRIGEKTNRQIIVVSLCLVETSCQNRGTFQIFFLIPTSMGMRIPVSHTMTALFGVAIARRSRSLIGMAPFRITLCFLAAALFFPVSPGSAQEIRPLPSHQSLDWY